MVPVLPMAPTVQGEPPKGRVLYVRQTVGDDANDGLSPAKAWRSLSMLENSMRAGDTAYVGPGLYREMVTVANGGTAEKRITFIADAAGEHTTDPPGIVMITGADPVDETLFSPQSTPAVYMAPSPDQRVLGVVEMDGPQYRYTSARDTAEHLREGMPELDVVAKRPSTYFYDYDAKHVYIHTSDGKPPSTHEIELIRRRSGFVTFEKPYVTVIGFTFRHMGVAGINFVAGSGNGVAINNTSYGAWQGIRVFKSTNVLVGGNTLFRNGNSGVYFFGASAHGYAIGNIAYENAKGVRWSSDSPDGLALDNVAFANREMGISIENAADIRVIGNLLVNNATAQLRVKKSRYLAQGNCFESGDAEQLIAYLDHRERYKTLAEYQNAVKQDLSSRQVCGKLPEKIDVHRLHAETSSYAERARKMLARGKK
jgi:hypothetical protein